MMLQRLLTESEEDDARWKYLLQTMEKARVAQNVILQLNQSYNDCVAAKDIIVSLENNRKRLYSLFSKIWRRFLDVKKTRKEPWERGCKTHDCFLLRNTP